MGFAAGVLPSGQGHFHSPRSRELVCTPFGGGGWFLVVFPEAFIRRDCIEAHRGGSIKRLLCD